MRISLWVELLQEMGGDVPGQVGYGKMARGLTFLGSFYKSEIPGSHPVILIPVLLRQGPDICTLK